MIRYIDPINGNNNNDGLTKETAWFDFYNIPADAGFDVRILPGDVMIYDSDYGKVIKQGNNYRGLNEDQEVRFVLIQEEYLGNTYGEIKNANFQNIVFVYNNTLKSGFIDFYDNVTINKCIFDNIIIRLSKNTIFSQNVIKNCKGNGQHPNIIEIPHSTINSFIKIHNNYIDGGNAANIYSSYSRLFTLGGGSYNGFSFRGNFVKRIGHIELFYSYSSGSLIKDIQIENNIFTDMNYFLFPPGYIVSGSNLAFDVNTIIRNNIFNNINYITLPTGGAGNGSGSTNFLNSVFRNLTPGTFDYNCWYDIKYQTPIQIVEDGLQTWHNVYTDPLFDYETGILQEGSSCIGTGWNSGDIPVNGTNNPDIGIYQGALTTQTFQNSVIITKPIMRDLSKEFYIVFAETYGDVKIFISEGTTTSDFGGWKLISIGTKLKFNPDTAYIKFKIVLNNEGNTPGKIKYFIVQEP